MKNISSEMKVGILAAVSLAALAALLYKTGSFDFQNEGYIVKAAFSAAAGVERNAPVRLAGVDIGKVRSIELSCDKTPGAIVTLWLRNNVKLKEDAKALITALGLMGEKYIEVTAGSENAPCLKPGSIIAGEDPLLFDSLAKKGEVIAKNLDETLSSIQKLAENANIVVVENRQKISNIFDNLEVTTQNMEEFTEDIKRNPWKLMNKPR